MNEQEKEKTILLGKSIPQLKLFAQQIGLPPFAGSQIADWIYRKGAYSFSQMTNISLANRNLLQQKAIVGRQKPIHEVTSFDGTRKYLFPVGVSNKFVETVMIPDGDRKTLCISSQIGCKMNCLFCMTGKQGFNGNLTVAEILNQCLSVKEWNKVSNIVFMGMGEPMDNIEAVLDAIAILTEPKTIGMSPKRITVSTVGVEKGLVRFLNETSCHLAISLHNAIPNERASIMPVERGMPICNLVALLKQYDFTGQRRLTFEYIVFSGLNDTPHHIKALIQIAKQVPCRVNLIRYHAIPGITLPNTSKESITNFCNQLNLAGINSTIRQSRGEDIDAACGMLSTKEEEKEKRQ